MYSWCLLFLCLPVTLLVQVLVPIRVFGVWQYLPWMHGVVIYYALNHKLSVACTVAILAGLLVDGFTFSQPGMGVFLYGMIVYLAERFRQQIVPEAMITASVFGVVAGSTLVLLRLGILWAEGHQGLTLGRALATLGFAVVSGAICVPAVGYLLQVIHRGLDLRTGEEGQHVNA